MLGFLGKYNDLGNYVCHELGEEEPNTDLVSVKNKRRAQLYLGWFQNPKSQSPQKCSERHTGKVTDAGTKAEGKTALYVTHEGH